MLIKTLAPITINEDWMKVPLQIAASEFAEVADSVGEAAVVQGAAVPATLEEARAACPTYKPLEDAEALIDFAAGKGPKTEYMPLTPAAGAEPGAWTPPTAVVEAVEQHKNKKGKKSN